VGKLRSPRGESWHLG